MDGLNTPQRILAVASGGGHWIQLMRLRPAMARHDLAFVTVDSGYREQAAPARFYTVCDGSQWTKLRLLCMAAKMAWIVLRERPDVVVSTGAAPGYFALRFGKWVGARTIWLDSIANVERLSLSGKLVRPYADLWLTQWEHLALHDGPEFAGSVV